MALPFTATVTGSDIKADPLTAALHEYDPLSDC